MTYSTKKIIMTSVLLAVIVFAGFFSGAASGQLIKNKDEAAREKYSQAKQAYLKEVDLYKNARLSFLNARAKYRQLKNPENRADYELRAKDFLKQMVSVMLKRLEVIKNKVENSPSISDSERQSILSEIDQDINWLKEKQSKIETATPEQLREEAKAVRDYWKNIRTKVKKVIGLMLAARINFVLAKAESYSEEIALKLSELKATGKETSELETWLAEFDQKINLAKEKHQSAKEKFEAISSLFDMDKLFRSGHQFIKEAHNYIKEAHKRLIDILRGLKKLGTAVSPTDEKSTTTDSSVLDPSAGRTRVSEEYYGSSTLGGCNGDSDCLVSGCNSEICQSRAEEPMNSICILPERPTPKQLGYDCKCNPQTNKCQWLK